MRVGLNRITGQILTGWAHCEQSLHVIVSTRVGARVMRRHFGVRDKGLQDRVPNPRNVMGHFVEIARAVRLWEPGYRLRRLWLEPAVDGTAGLGMDGTFYERGHLGDYSSGEQRSTTVLLARRGLDVS